MNHSSEIAKSIGVLFEMLTDRGIDASVLKSFSQTEVANSPVFAIDIAVPKIKIVFDVSNKLKWVDVKKTIDFDDETDVDLVILVVKDKVNNSEQKKIAELKVDYQVFDLRDLQFNISRHLLVPKHELVTDDVEITKVLDAYQVKKNQLPLILKTDPMAKYLNAKAGNLVKVTRISPTSGEYIVYRCVGA